MQHGTRDSEHTDTSARRGGRPRFRTTTPLDMAVVRAEGARLTREALRAVRQALADAPGIPRAQRYVVLDVGSDRPRIEHLFEACAALGQSPALPPIVGAKLEQAFLCLLRSCFPAERRSLAAVLRAEALAQGTADAASVIALISENPVELRATEDALIAHRVELDALINQVAIRRRTLEASRSPRSSHLSLSRGART